MNVKGPAELLREKYEASALIPGKPWHELDPADRKFWILCNGVVEELIENGYLTVSPIPSGDEPDPWLGTMHDDNQYGQGTL